MTNWQQAKLITAKGIATAALTLGLLGCDAAPYPVALQNGIVPAYKARQLMAENSVASGAGSKQAGTPAGAGDMPSAADGGAPSPAAAATLKVNILDYGARGDGVTNNYNAIVSAINFANDKGGGVVYFPAGHYMSARFELNNLHNVTLLLSPGTVLQMIDAVPEELYQPFIRFTGGSTNCHIIAYGAVIKRNKAKYKSGEHRHAISFNQSSNCSVQGGKISDSGGDGIYLAYPGRDGYPQDILIKDVQLDNHRRQGISIISGSGIKIINALITNTSGTKPGAAIDIEPNPDHYVYSVYIENLTSKNNEGAALHIYPRFGPTDLETKISVSGLSSYRDKNVLLIGGSKDRTLPLDINIEKLQGDQHLSSGIVLRELGGGTNIKISGKLNSNRQSAVAVGHDSTDEDNIKGSPSAQVDLSITGTGYSIYSYTSSYHLYNMSKNMYFRIRNEGTKRVSNFGNFFAKIDTDVVSYNDKAQDATLGPWDTMQGTRVVRAANESRPILLTLDDSKYRPGSIVRLEAAGKNGFKIGNTGAGSFLPFESDVIKTGQRGASITLEKLDSNNWSVMQMTGVWAKE